MPHTQLYETEIIERVKSAKKSLFVCLNFEDANLRNYRTGVNFFLYLIEKGFSLFNITLPAITAKLY